MKLKKYICCHGAQMQPMCVPRGCCIGASGRPWLGVSQPCRVSFMYLDNQGPDALMHHAVLKGLTHRDMKWISMQIRTFPKSLNTCHSTQILHSSNVKSLYLSNQFSWLRRGLHAQAKTEPSGRDGWQGVGSIRVKAWHSCDMQA